MSLELLREALGPLVDSASRLTVIDGEVPKLVENLRQHVVALPHENRSALWRTAAEYIKAKDIPGGFSPELLWFFSHPTFPVFEDFIKDVKLCGLFASYLAIILETKPRTGTLLDRIASLLGIYRNDLRKEKLDHAWAIVTELGKNYLNLLLTDLSRSFPHVDFKRSRNRFWQDIGLIPLPLPEPQSYARQLERARKYGVRSSIRHGGQILTGAEFARIIDPPPLPDPDKFYSEFEFTPTFKDPPWRYFKFSAYGEVKLYEKFRKHLLRGKWTRFTIEDRKTVKVVGGFPNYKVRENALLEDGGGEGSFSGAYRRLREIKYGLLPIGLKIHCAKENAPGYKFLARGGFAAHNADTCFNLPPVGNFAAARELLRSIEKRAGVSYLNNPDYQVQVCSLGRLNNTHAAILGVAFYLGSDRIRRYQRGDFATTHQYATRDRLVIYDAGQYDRSFPFWRKTHDGGLEVTEVNWDGRTDVLSCQSLQDIAHVNLAASLLAHVQFGGYWEELGKKFRAEIVALLERHQLAGVLKAQWVDSGGEDNYSPDFFEVFDELMDCAFADVEEINKARAVGNNERAERGILFEMQEILQSYHHAIKMLSPPQETERSTS